uniref:Uncharacterized protein n=1 Tax=Salix viminalis TaxID=40686 RepID=A0A6N2KTU4_SALVM
MDTRGGLIATDIRLGFTSLFVFVPAVVILGLFSFSYIEDKTEQFFCFCRGGDGGGMELVIFRNGILNFEGHRGEAAAAKARVSCFSLSSVASLASGIEGSRT